MLVLDALHPPLDEPPLRLTTDGSQVRTRVFGQGHSETTLADAAPGQDVPIGDAAQFTSGWVRSGPRIFAYTGVALGGQTTRTTGDPSSALGASSGTGQEPTPRISGGVPVWPYAQQYIVQFTTATGHGPAGGGTTVFLTYPHASSNPTATATTGGAMAAGTYEYHFSLQTGNGESPLRSAPVSVTLSGSNHAVRLDAPAISDGRILRFNVYRRLAGDQPLVLALTLESDEVRLDTAAVLTGPSPAATLGWEHSAVLLTDLLVGSDPRITGRTIFRRASTGTRGFYAIASIDNEVTEYLDTADESALGDPLEPWSTTAQPAGTGYVGVETTADLPTRGWVAVGSEFLYYDTDTGIGITVPVEGPGRVLNPIPYGTDVTVLAALTGVSLVLTDGEPDPEPLGVLLRGGSPVAVWVQRDDFAAQAAMAARAGGDDDGVYEYLVTDDLAPAALEARCDAELARYAAPLQTATFATLNRAARSGQMVAIDLAPLPLAATLLMQDVTISDVAVSTQAAARRTVTATSVRFTLEKVLRRLVAGLPT